MKPLRIDDDAVGGPRKGAPMSALTHFLPRRNAFGSRRTAAGRRRHLKSLTVVGAPELGAIRCCSGPDSGKTACYEASGRIAVPHLML